MERHTAMSKAEQVLRFIQLSVDGRTLKEIQTFILDMNGREKWLRKGYLRYHPMTGKLERTVKGRGYWTDYLYGTSYWGNHGFLHTHCVKLPSGKWFVTEPIYGPFRGKETKTLKHNRALWRGARVIHLESLPQCPTCDKPYEAHDRRLADKTRCIRVSAMTHVIDCNGDVWRTNNLHTSYHDTTWSITSLTEHELRTIESLARSLASTWDAQRELIWNELGKHLSKDGN